MKKLAILGASYLQKPLVLKANSMSIETHVFAWDNDEAVCKECADYFHPISVLEKEKILECCIQIGIDGITTIATDSCVPTISFIAEKLNLISNTYHSALLSTNKSKMRNAFREQNVLSPKSITIDFFDISDYSDFSFPLVVKPTDRSGSRGVAKVENTEDLKVAILNGINESFENKVVVEEFISGVEVSVESISWDGEHKILAVTDKITTGSPYFVEIAHHQPSQLTEDILNKIRTETIKALNSLHIKYGASHSEFKITENGIVYAIEVGARMGGDFIGSHLVQLSTGYDFLEGIINIALGEFDLNLVNIVNSKCAGIYFLCRETVNLLPYFESYNLFDYEKNIFYDNLNQVKNSNDRSGYLVYVSDKRLYL
jgi:biotin carboxylase